MDRRNFLSTSLGASALSLAGAEAADAAGTPEYYELRRYQQRSGAGTRVCDQYFSGVLIPALNRLGIGPVGAFSIYFGPDTPATYLLLPSAKLETLVTAELELAKDPAFLKVAAPFWEPQGGETPFITVESTLLRAFEGYPKLTVPAAAQKKEKRLYHLREYVSATPFNHARKVEMFHHGEFAIFARAGAANVFYADVLVGPRMPSLFYMLSFPDMAALEEGWAKFGADPEWKKLAADPRYKLDPPTVSNVSSLVLRPQAYSQV
ncbi:MAG: NIPSNAP family protein [Acidobacteriota bacterium]|nr:NIPSNAP family protein [Acidobacteriota bacterium]